MNTFIQKNNVKEYIMKFTEIIKKLNKEDYKRLRQEGLIDKLFDKLEDYIKGLTDREFEKQKRKYKSNHAAVLQRLRDQGW